VQLEGKVVVITGAARGLGRACAMRFAKEGASLVLLDVAANIEGVPYGLGTESQLEHTVAMCRSLGSAVLAMQVDIRNLQGIQRAAAVTLERFGRVDVLVNNAGIAAPAGKMVQDIEEVEWNLMMNVDLTGTWRAIKAYAAPMLSQRHGSIINVASTAGTVGYRHFAAYVAAKHGVIGLTRAAALDFGPHKVRVNALCPGSVRDDIDVEGQLLTEIARSLSVNIEEHEQVFAQAQPMNALIEPGDISSAATWLASDDSKQVTGAVITVDGGFTAR
jgi:NAD(P)-dependent dehydrogenase (short-subunit alcohol dehydrogenase family)